MTHTPVLEEKVIEALKIDASDVVVDATYGGGGHARAILARLGGRGRLLALDRDAEAVARARRDFGGDARAQAVHARFSTLGEILRARGLQRRVNAMLFDLGMSSLQLDAPQRGFGFRADGPLDMRMDTGAAPSAAEWLARVDEAGLARALREFGEERFAGRIARAIKRRRPASTADLAAVVADAVPTRERAKHPATRTFQAIRIAVNDELGEVRAVLPQALAGLAPCGRLAVLSFHSLEDRLVKRFLREQARGDPYPPDLPVRDALLRPRVKIIGKPLRADAAEVAANRRARSAVLRVAEKTAEANHVPH
ncbi:MAG: 16S rRNA (cytosine(1402)-N(4))-methyltransferase RsmH [Gammaproteobacteria bacterium]